MISLGTAIGAAAAGQRQRIAALETRTVIVTGTEAVVTGDTQPAGTIRFATDTGRVMVSTGSTWVGTSVGSAPAASATSGSSITGSVVTAGASATSGSSITGAVTSGALSGEAIGEGTGEGTAVGSTTSGALSGEAIGEGSGEGTAVGSTTSAFSQMYSLSLDGVNDYVELAGDVAVGNTWTYSVWLKPSTYSSSSLFGYLAADNNDGGAGGNTATRHGIGFVQSGTSHGGSGMVYYYSQTGTGSTQLSSTALTENIWNHVVITADVSNNQLKIYLNGSLDNTITKSNIQTVFDSLGRYSNLWYYDGGMDEVGFWDSILSATEVTALYNSGTPTDLASNAGNYSSSSNLIGWYRMEEGTGTTVADSSTNSNTGTLTNGPTFSTDVPFINKYSLLFDGTNSYLDIGSLSALSSASSFSVSFWFKNNGNSSGNIFGGWGSSAHNNIGCNPNYSANTFYFVVRSGSAAGALAVSSLSTYALSNTWNHFVCTFDGGDRVIYINGTQRASDTGVAPSTTSSSAGDNVAIGLRETYYAKGRIDEVALYSSALSQSEVTAIYNSGSPDDRSSDSSLLGYWRMEEGTGTTVTDLSSNSNTATLTNGPTFSTDTP